ncbi:MAG: hypothetical protein K2G24_06290, partial [Muribaculaceae bacterium]|nr:hypothetical protein [Muribaculaceae bacterium]
DRMFAESGDFNSIKNNKKSYFNTLVRNNPESDVIKSRINNWIGYGDRNDNLVYLGVADAALSSPHVVNRGDWLYLKAYIEETYNRNHSRALKFVRQALDHSFSREEMRHDAELMQHCLSAEQGELRSDLRYYIENLHNDNAIYFYIVPALLKQGRTSEAILLANYASASEGAHCYDDGCSLINGSYNRYEVPDNTYANTGFQLMLSRSAKEIAAYSKFLKSDSALVKEVIGRIRHDDDYLNEIIGTLYLREGNYGKAAEYLAQVSPDYQKNLNVYKCGYLSDNPWVNCYMPQDKWEYPSSDDNAVHDRQSIPASFNPANSSLLESDENAKLNFALEMSRLEGVMKSGNPDERGLARIRYAFARFNSFYSCWALTQYWRGNANQCNYQPIYWLWNGESRTLDYLKELTGQIPDQKWVDAQIKTGMKELQSPEALAEALFLTGNYKLVAKKYPHSSVGQYLSTHCDAWNNWL